MGIPDYGLWPWIGFTVAVVLLITLDLAVLHRTSRAITLREAALQYAGWVSLAALFNLGIFLSLGANKGLEFLTGYLIEVSLSVDNVFVWLAILLYFGVLPQHQYRVLFLGILGAIVLRGLFIAVGITLLSMFHWVIYVFGAFLIYTGATLAFREEEQVDLEKSVAVRLVHRFVPVTSEHHGESFVIQREGKWVATPLLVVLLAVAMTDIMFALDSIPAILSVTRDPFIVWTSNVAAVLGLRALFFLVQRAFTYFRYLKIGLAVVLGFVGVKMLLSDIYEVPIALSLAVVVGILGVSMLASYIATLRETRLVASVPSTPETPASDGASEQ